MPVRSGKGVALIEGRRAYQNQLLILPSASSALALAAALPSCLTLSSAASAPASRHAFLWLAGEEEGGDGEIREGGEEEGDAGKKEERERRRRRRRRRSGKKGD